MLLDQGRLTNIGQKFISRSYRMSKNSRITATTAFNFFKFLTTSNTHIPRLILVVIIELC